MLKIRNRAMAYVLALVMAVTTFGLWGIDTVNATEDPSTTGDSQNVEEEQQSETPSVQNEGNTPNVQNEDVTAMGVANPDDLIVPGDEITKDGTYYLGDETVTGDSIKIGGGLDVTIIGAGKRINYQYVKFECEENVSLTLQNLTILVNNGDTDSRVKFTGTGNTLTIKGTVQLENNTRNFSGGAVINVDPSTELTVKGDGKLFVFKKGGVTAIGGGVDQGNGTLTFDMAGGSLFAYGSQTGATIGGADSQPCTKPITFKSGTYYLGSNARGAVVGGGGTMQSCSADVTVEKDASVSIDAEFTGGIGSGGGNTDTSYSLPDLNTGKFIVKGGSVRTYVTSNAKQFSWGVTEEGATPHVIGLPKTNGTKEVSMLKLDTTGISGNTYNVKIDGKDFYNGSLHKYGYKETGKVTTSDLPAEWTDWGTVTDNNLYLYVTKGNHTVNINGTTKYAIYDASTDEFTLSDALDLSKATVSVAENTTYTGKSIKPVVSVAYGSALVAGRDYNVSYSNNTNVGRAKVTITPVSGKSVGSVVKTFNINPKGTTIKTPSKGQKYVRIKWYKRTTKMKKSRITGYQVQISKNANFTGDVKTRTVKGYARRLTTIKNLERKTTYYVRVKTYKNVGSATFYSGWSKVKKVTTK